MTRRLILWTLITTVCAALAVTAVIQPTGLRRADASTPGLVGTWMLTIHPVGGPTIKQLQTNSPDGAVIDGGGAQISSSPETENGSAGQGRWRSFGGSRFQARDISILVDVHRHFAGTFTTRNTESVSGDTLSGTAIWTFRNKNGKVYLHGTSTIIGTRIKT